MTIREEMEQREKEYLSPYAVLSSASKGRKRQEVPCDIRLEFQRDRDRILHCKAFRRLKQKTQVFLLPRGDHYRTRLTHTLEVSQNARTIAKALRLNEDLVEAIALGHDLGHTPFGHIGEYALNKVSSKGFSHNEQSVRIVEVVEKEGRGLNLTWEVIDGIRNHQTKGSPSTLEGKIVRLSDKIAYINHDIDDAIRGGILQPTDIPKRFRDLFGDTSRSRLNKMIHDVIIHSRDKNDIIQSEEIKEAMAELRSYMFSNVYKNPKIRAEEQKAIHMIENLYDYYIEHIEMLPQQFMNRLEQGDDQEQIVCDYIAGMTDNYAIKKYEEIFLPEAWKF